MTYVRRSETKDRPARAELLQFYKTGHNHIQLPKCPKIQIPWSLLKLRTTEQPSGKNLSSLLIEGFSSKLCSAQCSSNCFLIFLYLLPNWKKKKFQYFCPLFQQESQHWNSIPCWFSTHFLWWKNIEKIIWYFFKFFFNINTHGRSCYKALLSTNHCGTLTKKHLRLSALV